jgi:predicted transcriptional regulator
MARLTVQFPDRTSEMLSDLAVKDQKTKTEIIDRALALYNYLRRETQDGKHRIAVVDEDGKILKEIVMT